MFFSFKLSNQLKLVLVCWGDFVAWFFLNQVSYYVKQEEKRPRGLHLSKPSFWPSNPALHMQTFFPQMEGDKKCGTFLESSDG